METLTRKPLTATFTNYHGEWMIRTDRKLTTADYETEMRETLSGKMAPKEICRVEVTKRNGDVQTVTVGEYEAQFGDAHIYSIL